MELSTLILLVIGLLILTEALLLASTLYYDISENLVTISLVPILFIAIGGLAAAYAYCKNLETSNLVSSSSGDITRIRSIKHKKNKVEGTNQILNKIEEILNLQRHAAQDVIDPETKSKFDSLEPKSDTDESSSESESDSDNEVKDREDDDEQDPGLAMGIGLVDM